MKVHIYRTINSNPTIILYRKKHLEEQILQGNKLRKLVGRLPQLKLLAVFSHWSGHDNMSEQCNHICPAASISTHSFTQAWEHTHRQTVHIYIFLSLNPFTFRVVLNNLASHSHVILPSHIVFLCFKTNARMQ